MPNYCRALPPCKSPPDTELWRLARSLFEAVEARVFLGDPEVLGTATGELRVRAVEHALLYGTDSLERVIKYAVDVAQDLVSLQLSGPVAGPIFTEADLAFRLREDSDADKT